MRSAFKVSRDVREIIERLKAEEERAPSLYECICRIGHRLLGSATKSMKLQEGTMEKLAWAGLRVTPAEWWAGFLFLLLVPLLLGVVGFVVPLALGVGIWSIWYVPLLGALLGGLLSTTLYLYPGSAAGVRKSEAQSKAIETTMLLSFALYHNPDLRGAVVFAANSSEGKLAEDLQRGLLELDQKHSYESVRQLLVSIAHHWRDVDEGVRRAIFDVLRSGGQHDESVRRQDIAQAPQRVLRSSEEQLDARLGSLVMPTMTFMVFGSLAIVAVIGLSPVFGLVGVQLVDLNFFILAAAILVASFLAFTVFIGRQRPATIPPPRISPNDPRLPPPGKARILGHNISIWLPAVLVFAAFATPGVMYLAGFELGGLIGGLNTFWIIWGIAAGIAVYAYLYVGPRAKVREEVRRETEDWSMALNTMGSLVIDGRPMHQAMRETSRLMEDTTVGKQLQQLSNTMERTSVDPHYALFQGGLAEGIYNPLVTTMLDVTTQIRRGSEVAAGHASMMAAGFLDILRGVERRFEEKVSDATSNLWMMAIILLPVVCALSVWIMDFLSGISLTVGAEAAGAGLANIPFLTAVMETSELALLKLTMGLTAIALALVVARHIATIRAGRDRIEFWKAVAPTVLVTTVIFTAAYLGLGFIKMA